MTSPQQNHQKPSADTTLTDSESSFDETLQNDAVHDKALHNNGSDSRVASESRGDSSSAKGLTVAHMVEVQTDFIKQWLQQKYAALASDAWQWFGAQSLSQYLRAEDLQHLINEWLLTQPMSAVIRADIKAVLHTLIYHPVNDNVPLSELVDDTQIDQLATYIGSHEEQRRGLIHALIGNETFADLLTQTLYHAINDFMETTLDKAGGVGKLMKLGRSSFEKATNKNLDEKLQTYLHRNIKDLTKRAEVNAQEHLTNAEVARLVVEGWARIKDKPVSHLQSYLDEDAKSGSITHIEASLQQSYNRLRMSPYVHSLVAASIDTWYAAHQTDTIASVAASLHIDDDAMLHLSTTIQPIIYDVLDSSWLTAHIQEMLYAFYEKPTIQEALFK